jgi:SAM-dependent methyltransferase
LKAYAHQRKFTARPSPEVLNEREAARMRSLLELIPTQGESVLDIGARDGFLATQLVDRFGRIVALDLVQPMLSDARVECVAGDVRALRYGDASFDTVICAEVLEHVNPHSLEQACREIVRVARRAIVIGVPYRQDLRCGETHCTTCGRFNPPWGHQSRFDESRLRGLFRDVPVSTLAHVGNNRNVTNALSAKLMRFAGNPYGTYEQDEACVHCGARLVVPGQRSVAQKVATRIAVLLDRAQQAVTPARASWIHVRFDKAGPRPRPAA